MFELMIVTPHTMSVRQCECYSPIQDSLFGIKNRLHTLVKHKDTSIVKWYCTCCNGLKAVESGEIVND